jgi:hypothetical protein
MPNTMTLISTQTVGAGGAASISFTSIPQTYTDLIIKFSGRSTQSSTVIEMTFNGSATSYENKRMYGTGTSVASDSNNTTFISNLGNNDTGFTSNTFGSLDAYIANYTSSNYKSITGDGVSETQNATAYMLMGAGLWSNTAAITSITLTQTGANLTQYSTASLYGVKNS